MASLIDQGAEPVSVTRQLSTTEKFDAGYLRAFGCAPFTHFEAAQSLEEAGVPFINGTKLHLECHDKLKAQFKIEKSGLLMPASWTFSAVPDNFPMICKPVRGSGGTGVVLVQSRDQAILHQEALGVECMLQQYIKDARCLRVCTGQGQIGRIYAKCPPAGSVVASINQGASRGLLKTHPAAETLSLRALSVFGGGIAGIDILEDAEGKLWLLEINPSFAFDAQDKDLARWIASQIIAMPRTES